MVSCAAPLADFKGVRYDRVETPPKWGASFVLESGELLRCRARPQEAEDAQRKRQRRGMHSRIGYLHPDLYLLVAPCMASRKEAV